MDGFLPLDGPAPEGAGPVVDSAGDPDAQSMGGAAAFPPHDGLQVVDVLEDPYKLLGLHQVERDGAGNGLALGHYALGDIPDDCGLDQAPMCFLFVQVGLLDREAELLEVLVVLPDGGGGQPGLNGQMVLGCLVEGLEGFPVGGVVLQGKAVPEGTEVFLFVAGDQPVLGDAGQFLAEALLQCGFDVGVRGVIEPGDGLAEGWFVEVGVLGGPPWEGWCRVEVTDRRTKADWARVLQQVAIIFCFSG